MTPWFFCQHDGFFAWFASARRRDLDPAHGREEQAVELGARGPQKYAAVRMRTDEEQEQLRKNRRRRAGAIAPCGAHTPARER